MTGSVEADNAGNRYTGEYRVGATVNLNNPTGHGDVASLRVLTSGSGLNYGRASYQMQFGKATAGVAYTALNYHLGKEFEPLHAHGTARDRERLWQLSADPLAQYQPLRPRRFRRQDLSGQGGPDLVGHRQEGRRLVGGPAGNHLDGFGGGGASSYSLTQYFGDLDIETPGALAVDAATAHTNGHYQKLAFNVARLQRVTEKVSLYGAINGQFASKNLDISEKMGMGGPYAVRAYPVGEAYADEGYVVNLEARLLLPKFSERMPGQMHLVGFVDSGSVTLDKNPWTAGDNHRTLSGAGVGLTWADYNNFVVNLYWAQTGQRVATSAPDKSGRFWFQVSNFLIAA